MEHTAEHERLIEYEERESNWKHWGPYLAERAWGTVREDYSATGEAWSYFPHDQARSRAYRWNEDGLGGISDRYQRFCLALAFWNGVDPILKERLFGLSGPEGNHGEDVKEIYYYLDSTPTHSYMKMLYKYPQRAYPYEELLRVNGSRGREADEYELYDTGIFDEDRYFDIFIEYAKVAQNDLFLRVTAHNRGPEAATLHLLPTLWFRNTWSWGYEDGPKGETEGGWPHVHAMEGSSGVPTVQAWHPDDDTYYLYAREADELLFTNNDTNSERLFDSPNQSPYVKDAFHRYLIEGEEGAVNPAREGTKAATHYRREIPAGGQIEIVVRLCDHPEESPFDTVEETFTRRIEEADAFYETVHEDGLDDELRDIQRQAFGGMLWSKQLYYYDIPQWLDGDPGSPPPPPERRDGRNSDWRHLTCFDLISMPDKWEYPWFATWDLAFHCLPLTLVDPAFAKRQLTLLTREWYMHPNGQLPAYEWAFDDVNPPVHAWASWRVYKIDEKRQGRADRPWLEGIFHKLLLNFTWWVNRKDEDGQNVFQGGFLGLDNISVFDRSAELPTGGHIDQSDGTAWMGAYCLTLMRIALELAKEDPIYQDSATKLFEHFLRIAHAMTEEGRDGHALWNEEDGFFYDSLHLPDGTTHQLRLRSMVGLLPLFAVETIEPELLEAMPVFLRRMHWFLDNRPWIAGCMADIHTPGRGERRLASLVNRDRLIRVLGYMLDEKEFLSPHGIRSLSKAYDVEPYRLEAGGESHEVHYWPAESRNGLFGGNSNWRGPVWFPVNYLMIEALQRYHHYYGDDLEVECPTGSGRYMTLDAVATELSRRLIALFTRDESGRRPIYGDRERFQKDPHWRDYLLFHEYFHGDDGRGLGANHQTGWTGLVAKLIQQSGAT